ncbi:MAG TPA: hypothetical protein VKB37_20655 [Jatrophihabitantaceae bacterium]|nr:hypothetical protein [Jatrophihabitantaceae bacterium]
MTTPPQPPHGGEPDWATERQTIVRLHQASPRATCTELQNAVQVVLEAVTDAIDAAERRTDREWLQQRARGAAAVLHAIASQVISS